MSYVIARVVKAIIGLRLDREDEAAGIDEIEHAETAYDFSTLRSIGGIGTPRPDAATPAAAQHVPAHASKES
jgi:Amt family ammonium transporter